MYPKAHFDTKGNGIETTKEIKTINPNIKIIFISADYSVKDKALEVGAIDFLEKPIDFNTLFRIIEKHTLAESNTHKNENYFFKS